MLKTVAKYCFENSDFSGIWWIEGSKEQHLFEIENFCKIINVFTVTFNLLNESINFSEIMKSYSPQTFEQ